MSWKDDLLERHLEQQRDEELRKRYQDLNLNAEIAALKARDEPPPDPIQQKISRKLVRAQGSLVLAFERRTGFFDALDDANDVLQLDRNNSEALAMRALANYQLGNFREAVEDAEASIAADPDDSSPFSVRIRRELPFWRAFVGD